MGLQLGTGKARKTNLLLEALQRGRKDIQFFSYTFLGNTLHDGQLEWCQEAEATINALATANRYGKTFLLPARHYHRCTYKIGAESKYLAVDGSVDTKKFLKTKYHTVHTAGSWETASLVFEEAHKLKNQSKPLDALISAAPRALPPHIKFVNGSVWKFRTLGHDASGIDGNSFYYISIDEAGWIDDLEEKMRNVIRVRVADVQGCIDIVGTFKPGISKDFYKICTRASVYTGTEIGFDHKDGVEDSTTTAGLHAAITTYLAEFGIDLSEYGDAIGG